MFWICSHTLRRWMVSHKFRFVHVPSNYLMLAIFFSHFVQLNGFSSVWILSWLFKLPACVNVLSHFEQLNYFSSVRILSWLFKLLDVANFFSHFVQLNSLSPVSILSWQSNLLVLVNALPHFEQLNSFLKVVHSTPFFLDLSGSWLNLLLIVSYPSINSWAVFGESATDSRDSAFVVLHNKYNVVFKTIIWGKYCQLKWWLIWGIL